jgi:hypothetical protein
VPQLPYSPDLALCDFLLFRFWNTTWKESISLGKTRWLLSSERFLTKSCCRRSRTWWMIGSTDWEGVFNLEESTFMN